MQRLLEDSWKTRSRRFNRRELVAEALAAAAVPRLRHTAGAERPGLPPVDPLLAVVLVCLYALASRMIKFPIGAGYVVPSYLVLVPMLLLLPPGIVPLLTAAGLILGTLGQVAVATRRAPSGSCSRYPTPGMRSDRRSCWCSSAPSTAARAWRSSTSRPSSPAA